MRKVRKNSIITVRAMKRHKQMILSDTGRSLPIKPDLYTNNIQFAEWMYWVLKRTVNDYIVLKVICPSEISPTSLDLIN